MKNTWGEDEVGCPFPVKGSENNKDSYTIAIIKARELHISYDAVWSSNKKKEIEEHNTIRNSEAMDSIARRLSDMSSSRFSNLTISGSLFQAYSEKYKMPTESNNETENSIRQSVSTTTVRVRSRGFSFGE